MVRKMAGISAVFGMRSEPINNKSFIAFRFLLDAYVDLCNESLKAGKDFMDDGLDLDSNEGSRERLKAAFQAVFGVPPNDV
jgi:hypothetical protein